MANFCPKCGGELPMGATICANCGAAADEKPDVDNSAAIARMLSGEPDELNDRQIEDFESGKPIELSSGGLSEEALGDIATMDSMDFDELLTEEAASVPAASPVVSLGAGNPDSGAIPVGNFDGGVIGFEPSNDDHDNIIIQSGVTEMHRFRMPRIVKRIIACVLLLSAGFGLGFGLHYFMSYGLFANHTNSIALKSSRAVMLRVIPEGQEFKPIDIYVKRDAHTTECIIFGVLFSEVNDYTATYFRWVINNDDHSESRLFLPFNQARYLELLNSDDPQERLTASTMKGNYDSFLLSLSEINAGNPRWERADTAYVNKRLLVS
ncbi:MAG: zinc ribbon domain-containing protein [Oscillospiraceae bacterium]|nr:zinc ribbon domain-containing protein [Oscillospiraceae bacterium]